MRPGRAPASLVTGAWGVAACAALAVAVALGAAGCPRSKRLPPRADGAAVVLVAPDSGAEPGVPIVAEIEPNQAPASAQKIELASPGALAIQGSIRADPEKGKKQSRDYDYYRLVVVPEAPAPGAGPAESVGARDAAVARPTSRRRLSVRVHPALELGVVVELLDDAGQLLAGAPAGG